MATPENGLSKEERLFRKRSIDLLFAQGKSFMAYPLRVVYLINESESGCPSLLISVPKKRMKRAVQRNRVKRLVREAYRVRKHRIAVRGPGSRPLWVAFLYVGNEVVSFPVIEKAMDKAMSVLYEKTL